MTYTEPTDSTGPIREPLFYRPDLPPAGDVTLTGAEAHHVVVQRLRAGDAIALFDGRGKLARGRIASIARQAVRITIERHEHEPPPAPAIDLYTAAPKGERQSVLLDMATQLGVTRVVPVAWRRSVATPGAQTLERWRRVALEACKQSRRLHVPAVLDVLPFADALDAAAADGARLVVGDTDTAARSPLALDLTGVARLAIFVGPEGGIVDDELTQLHARRADIVRLGRSVLRVEAAAVALIAALRAAADVSPPDYRDRR